MFAVSVLPRRFPDLINDDDDLLSNPFVVPSPVLGEVAATVRAGTQAALPGSPAQPKSGRQ